MKRLYAAEISYLLLCGLATAAWVVPELFAVVGVFTLGLAWLVPTLWIYNSAFVPGYLAALWLQRVEAFWVISVPLVVALAMAPPFIAEQQIHQVKSDLYRGDFKDEMPTVSQHIAFQVEPLSGYIELPDPLSEAPCGILCQRLLLNRVYQSVTIEAAHRNAKQPLSIEYRIENRNGCPRVFAKTRQAIPDLLRANIEGRCLIATIDKPMLNGLVVHEERPVSLGSYRSSFWSIRKLERFSVAHRKNRIDVLIARQTRLEIDRVAYPTMLLTYGGIFTTVSGWRYASIADSARINSVIDFLERDMKLDLGVRPTGSSLGSRRYGESRLTAMGGTHLSPTSADVRKLLAAPPDSPLNDELQGLVNRWASQFSIGKKWETVPAADAELAVSLIDDPRMTTLDGVVLLLQGNPAGKPGSVWARSDPKATQGQKILFQCCCARGRLCRRSRTLCALGRRCPNQFGSRLRQFAVSCAKGNTDQRRTAESHNCNYGTARFRTEATGKSAHKLYSRRQERLPSMKAARPSAAMCRSD